MVSVAGGAPRAGGPSGLREGPPGAARGRLESVARWMGVEEEWERVPGPGAPGQDRRIAAAFLVLVVATLELLRSLGATADQGRPLWQQYAILLAAVAPLVVRRRYPLSVALATQAAFFLVALTMPGLGYSLVIQFLCFYGLYSGVAWARDRRALLVLLGGVFVFMAGWLAWDFALGNSMAQLTTDAATRGADGPLSPAVAWIVYTLLINVVFFGGAVLLGQSAWHGARRGAIVAKQATTIVAQAEELRDQAVVDERLRIARELHDVVAHHVSVMGVQAAAARRVLDRRPEAAAQSLRHIEDASRQAVTELRTLLGSLRTVRPGQTPQAREPGPGIAAIADLCAAAQTPGFDVGFDLVAEPDDALDAVPAPMALSVYRIVQEALSNVRKHSSANRVGVVVRVRHDPAAGGAGGPGPAGGSRGAAGYVEAEVVDNGRPVPGSSGSGVGLLGMRERAASHGGVVETGPRFSSPGYRVRARFPLPARVEQ